MKTLFLTSSTNKVATAVASKIGKKGLTLTFIKTASEVESGDLWWLKADREALVKSGFKVTDYTLTGKNETQVKNDLKETNVIFFSGGNTFYLLEQIQLSHSAGVIKKYIEDGKIYIGSSAGSLVAGPDIYSTRFADDPSQAPKIKGYKGLGLVDFIPFPHWGSEDFRDSYLKKLSYIYNDDHKIILINDYQYIQVEGDTYKIEEVSHK